MEHLPVELLHAIFQNLPFHDVCSMRLTCQSFKEIGECHLIKEIYLLPITPSLKRLQDISQHPFLRCHVNSLFFEADTMYDLDTYSDWYDRIPSDSLRERYRPVPPAFHIHSDLSESWLRAAKRCTKLRDQHCKPPARAPHTDTALDDDYLDASSPEALECQYYRAFKDLAGDINSLYKNNTYTPILRDAIALLPALRHVSLSIQAGLRPRCAKFYSVFEKGLIVPICDQRQQRRQGEQQLFGLLEAIAAANAKLESLEIAYIHFFVLQQEEHPERLLLWSAQMATLKRLTLGISLGHLFNTYGRRCLAQESLPYLRSTGTLVTLLASAPLLRYLSVRFDWDNPYPVDMADIVGDATWPHLREVEFAYMYASRHTLEEFYKRHRATLRILKLTHVALCGLQEDDDAFRKAQSGFWLDCEGFGAIGQNFRAWGFTFGWAVLYVGAGRWVDLELWKEAS